MSRCVVYIWPMIAAEQHMGIIQSSDPQIQKKKPQNVVQLQKHDVKMTTLKVCCVSSHCWVGVSQLRVNAAATMGRLGRTVKNVAAGFLFLVMWFQPPWRRRPHIASLPVALVSLFLEQAAQQRPLRNLADSSNRPSPFQTIPGNKVYWLFKNQWRHRMCKKKKLRKLLLVPLTHDCSDPHHLWV